MYTFVDLHFVNKQIRKKVNNEVFKLRAIGRLCFSRCRNGVFHNVGRTKKKLSDVCVIKCLYFSRKRSRAFLLICIGIWL